MHAALQINGGMLMLNDDFSESMNCKRETPETLGGSPVVFNLQVDNADAAWDQALAAGATIKFPLANQFWGDRYGQVTDPFGHYWAICQTISKPTAEEVEEGAKAAFAG